MGIAFNGLKAQLDADSADIHILMLGDSTGETSSEWVGYFMYLLHYYYPSFTVSYSEWYNGGTLTWTTPATIHTGSGSNTVHVWCAGDGGAGCDYFTDREVAIIQHPTDVDFCTIALGHNTTRGESDFNALVEMVEDNWPSAHITMFKQNPRYDDFDLGATTAATVETVASTYDTGLVDVRKAFLANSDPRNNLMGDDVHPNHLGRRLWGETAWLTIYPEGGFPVASLDTAVLLMQAKNYSGTGYWLDESGNGNHVTADFGVTWSSGDGTLAMPHWRFSGGAPNYSNMTISDSDSLDFDGSTSWTAMVVGTVDSPSGTDVFLDKGGVTGTAQGGFALHSATSTSIVGTTSELGVATNTDTHQTALVADQLHVMVARHNKVGTELAVFLDGVKGSSPAGPGGYDNTNTENLQVGARTNPVNYGFLTGRIVAIAIWDVALTDQELWINGKILAGKDPRTLHGDALFRWIVDNDPNWTSDSSLEIVGLLNELNGTIGKEYAEARGTYLGVPPAG